MADTGTICRGKRGKMEKKGKNGKCIAKNAILISKIQRKKKKEKYNNLLYIQTSQKNTK